MLFHDTYTISSLFVSKSGSNLRKTLNARDLSTLAVLYVCKSCFVLFFLLLEYYTLHIHDLIFQLHIYSIHGYNNLTCILFKAVQFVSSIKKFYKKVFDRKILDNDLKLCISVQHYMMFL